MLGLQATNARILQVAFAEFVRYGFADARQDPEAGPP